MTKQFCDACGKELVGSDGRMGISIPCHHLMCLSEAHSDNDGNPISQRTVAFDLCNLCSNRIYSMAVKTLQGLQTSLKNHLKKEDIQ